MQSICFKKKGSLVIKKLQGTGGINAGFLHTTATSLMPKNKQQQ